MACEMLHEVGGSRAAGGKRLRGKVSTLFKLNQRYSTQKTVESGLGRISIFEHVPHAVRMPPPFGIEPGINHIDRRRGRAELRLSPICFCANNTKQLSPTSTPQVMCHANSPAGTRRLAQPRND